MSISYSPSYSLAYYEDEEDSSKNHVYGSRYKNGVSREIYDVYYSSPTAVAMAGGVQVARATANNPFKLMTITKESKLIQEDNYSTINKTAYVIACGSVDFASADLLGSNFYGNSDTLLLALRVIGREPTPAGLTFTPFANYIIEGVTSSQSTQWIVLLTVTPAVIALSAGIFVIVRRKYR